MDHTRALGTSLEASFLCKNVELFILLAIRKLYLSLLASHHQVPRLHALKTVFFEAEIATEMVGYV